MEFISKYFRELTNLFIEMAPWLLFGLLIAGLFHVYFPLKYVNSLLGKNNFRSSLNAAFIGVPLPLCSCGVIPTAISLYKSGASKGATNSFLISTPQTGVDSILATYSMLGWPFAILRPLAAFITGVAGGVVTNLFFRNKDADNNISSANSSVGNELNNNSGNQFEMTESCEIGTYRSKYSLIEALRYAFIELLQDIAKWLIIGFLPAALSSTILPDDFFSSFRGYGILEILVVLAASAPIYICATGSIPIAAVLLMKGVSPGAALVFLMAGPATNIATMTVIGKAMGRKSLIIYMLSISIGAIVFGMLTNWLLPQEWIMAKITHSHEHCNDNMLPMWVLYASALIILGSIIFGYLYSIITKRKSMDKHQGITVKVTGMSCSHCEATVKKHLETIDGIDKVEADARNNSVKITGDAIDIEKVKSTVNSLGYSFEG